MQYWEYTYKAVAARFARTSVSDIMQYWEYTYKAVAAGFARTSVGDYHRLLDITEHFKMIPAP
jgi:hypothetical protein